MNFDLQSILERLGWKIRRIWSTDWFKNPHAELAPIIRDLHQLKSKPAPKLPEEPLQARPVKARPRVEKVADLNLSLFSTDGETLRERLVRFDQEVIQQYFPDTPSDKRLLRPAMLEALVEFAPTSKYEFLESVPSYLRQATDGREGKFIEQVFEIINASFESA